MPKELSPHGVCSSTAVIMFFMSHISVYQLSLYFLKRHTMTWHWVFLVVKTHTLWYLHKGENTNCSCDCSPVFGWKAEDVYWVYWRWWTVTGSCEDQNRVVFIRPQTEEKGLKPGSATWNGLIRKMRFPLQSTLTCPRLLPTVTDWQQTRLNHGEQGFPAQTFTLAGWTTTSISLCHIVL